MAFTSVGAALRAERIRQGLSLADVARRTRISQKFLTEIESENFEALPGLVFTRNFVRTYASELKIDSESLLAELPRVDLAVSPMPDPPDRVHKSAWDPRLNSALASLAWIVLAVGAAAAAYVHFNKPAAPAPPARAAAAPSPTKPPVVTAPLPKAEPLPAVAASTPVERQPVEVVLMARQASWVQITADGKNAFTGVMQPNDTKTFGAHELVKLVTGNAGGVAVTLNGKQLDALGPEGQVRTVRLTAEGLQLVPKTPPPPPSDPL